MQHGAVPESETAAGDTRRAWSMSTTIWAEQCAADAAAVPLSSLAFMYLQVKVPTKSRGASRLTSLRLRLSSLTSTAVLNLATTPRATESKDRHPASAEPDDSARTTKFKFYNISWEAPRSTKFSINYNSVF